MKIGLIADIQYCDCDNDWNYEKTMQRFYRNSINHLDNSLKYFASNNCEKILQLGDLIDGRCGRFKNFESCKSLIKERFENNYFETFHVTGNHELYNFTRKQLIESFIGTSVRKYRKPYSDVNYYKVQLAPNISLIVLDTYEISVLNKRELPETDEDYVEAKNILTANNKNESWNEPIGAKRAKFVAFNGGVGKCQLEWLEEQLVECRMANNIVIVAGHIPIISKSENPLCMVWNEHEVLRVIDKFPCVKAYICGHEHFGSIIHMKQQPHQFVHITMPGIIEAKHSSQPFGILEIFNDKLVITDMPGFWEQTEFNF